MNVIAGPAGTGKSTILYDLAARVSREGGRVLIATAEDHLAAVVGPRLEAAGADLKRIRLVTADLTLPDGIDRLEAWAREFSADLIIVDPLVAFLETRIDSHKDSSVRQALRPLAGLAERLNVAQVVVLHTNKAAGEDPLLRISGSGGFAAAARHVLIAANDPNDETGQRRVLAVVKSNLAEFAAPLGYQIEGATIAGDEGPISTSRIRWGDELPDLDTRSLLAAPNRDEATARDEAKDFLLEVLAGGPQPASEVEREGNELGIAKRTLERARRDMGVKSSRIGGLGGRGGWQLELPQRKSATKSANTALSLNSGGLGGLSAEQREKARHSLTPPHTLTTGNGDSTSPHLSGDLLAVSEVRDAAPAFSPEQVERSQATIKRITGEQDAEDFIEGTSE